MKYPTIQQRLNLRKCAFCFRCIHRWLRLRRQWFVLNSQNCRAIQKFIMSNVGFSDFRRNCNFVVDLLHGDFHRFLLNSFSSGCCTFYFAFFPLSLFIPFVLLCRYDSLNFSYFSWVVLCLLVNFMEAGEKKVYLKCTQHITCRRWNIRKERDSKKKKRRKWIFTEK